jgi:phage tail-like protein
MPERVDPVAGFRFAVEIADVTHAVFTECNGLTVERGVTPVKQGGVNDYVHTLPEPIKEASRVTLKRGFAADGSLWAWFQKGLYDCKIERRAVTITLYDTNLTVLRRWTLKDAFPVKWTGPDLKSDSNQAAIETLELVHHGLTAQ